METSLSVLVDAFLLAAAAVASGGTVFYLLIAVAVRRLPSQPPPLVSSPPPRVSVLKPLSGLDLGLEQNLASFFRIDYSDFEILFGVHAADDPAAAVARRLIDAHPEISARLFVAGEPSPERNPNPKILTLTRLAAEASGAILVVSDSDIHAEPDCLRHIAADYADPEVGVSTCPYLGVGGPSIWSELEAIGMNTEFWGGVFVARMLGPMDFAVGPTMAVRAACLEELGGFDAYREYLAEDFVIGRDAHAAGWRVVLSGHVVEHRIGSQPFLPNLKHRLRWYRSTRRSRPAGYAAQIFTYPVPFAAILALAGAPGGWPLLALCLATRVVAARAAAGYLGQRTGFRFWALLPVQDLLSFLTWVGAFFGSRIVWRSHELHLDRDGRLRPIRRS